MKYNFYSRFYRFMMDDKRQEVFAIWAARVVILYFGFILLFSIIDSIFAAIYGFRV